MAGLHKGQGGMERRNAKALPRGLRRQRGDDREDMQFEADGDRHFMGGGRNAEFTDELVLRARARMAGEQVNGPEESTVTETIKELLQEKTYEITKCFQALFTGREEAPSCWKIVNLVFSTEPGAEPKTEIRSHTTIVLA